MRRGASCGSPKTAATCREILNFRLLPDRSENSIAFLKGLRAHMGGPMTILRDRSRIHGRSSLVKAYLARHPEIVAVHFPEYAPEASPDEGVLGWTKYKQLPNYVPDDTADLRSRLCLDLSALRRRPALLTSFIRHAVIPPRL